MPIPTITYSLSYATPEAEMSELMALGLTPSPRSGTYFNAREYPVSETERAESEWAANLARFQAEHPTALDARIHRSEVWQKMTHEEHMARIERANAAQAIPFERMQLWDR